MRSPKLSLLYTQANLPDTVLSLHLPVLGSLDCSCDILSTASGSVHGAQPREHSPGIIDQGAHSRMHSLGSTKRVLAEEAGATQQSRHT